jgi:dihydrofolate reductase
MSKVVYFTASTLDGFIADEHDSLDWLFETPHSEDESAWDEFIAAIGPMCMGRTTYEWMLRHYPDLLTGPEQWRAFYADRPAWVFTHRTDLPTVVGADIRFVRGDVRPVHEEMIASRRGDVWIIGGGDLVGQFDDAGLLDRVIVGLCPVTLGAGAPLLPRRITSERMRIVEVGREGQQVRIVLDVDRRPPSHPFLGSRGETSSSFFLE